MKLQELLNYKKEMERKCVIWEQSSQPDQGHGRKLEGLCVLCYLIT